MVKQSNIHILKAGPSVHVQAPSSEITHFLSAMLSQTPLMPVGRVQHIWKSDRTLLLGSNAFTTVPGC